jgi:hypothetical protein
MRGSKILIEQLDQMTRENTQPYLFKRILKKQLSDANPGLIEVNDTEKKLAGLCERS